MTRQKDVLDETVGDAWGLALVDHLEGRQISDVLLECDVGS